MLLQWSGLPTLSMLWKLPSFRPPTQGLVGCSAARAAAMEVVSWLSSLATATGSQQWWWCDFAVVRLHLSSH
ncbi:hypothetical protein ACFX2C_040626 [Malus domestica]